MELLFSTVIALGIGFIIGALAPGRDTLGSLLVPAASAAASAVVWVALVWAGWRFDGTWIWVVSIAVATITAVALVLILPKRRRAADEELQHRLATRA
jgi:xanthine/uracil permease